MPSGAARIAQHGDASTRGLLLEEARENKLLAPRDLGASAWTTGTGTTARDAAAGPDGAMMADQSTIAERKYSNLQRIVLTGSCVASQWLRAVSAGEPAKAFQFVITNDPGAVWYMRGTAGTTWRQVVAPIVPANGGALYFEPFNGNDIGQGPLAQDFYSDLHQFELGAFPTSWTPGKRGEDQLGHPNVSELMDQDRFAFEAELRPIAAFDRYSAPTAIWGVGDAWAVVDSVHVRARGGGSSSESFMGNAIDRYGPADRVRIFVAVDNLERRIEYVTQVQDGPVHRGSTSLSGPVPVGQPVSILRGTADGQCWSSCVQRLGTYRRGQSPAWTNAPLGYDVRRELAPVLWLNADRGVDLDSEGRVARWLDQSWDDSHLEQADPKLRPRFIAAALGTRSRPAIDFGNGTFLEHVGNLLDAANSAYSVLIVGQSGNGALLTLRRSSVYSASLLFKSQNVFYVHGDGKNAFANVTTADLSNEITGTAFASAHVYSGGTTNPTIYLNGLQRPITSSGTRQTTEDGSAGLFLGKSPSGQPWGGLISEVIVLNSAISAAALQKLLTYQTEFFGLPPAGG
ncbi:LamG domain-containing protein [Pendulispora brunnea]|uniref:LamG domain-containing protein n=1 Tax=Pendulispora brunnea TaxID=2905690 RepID=A0ABZ2K7D0_9BACT